MKEEQIDKKIRNSRIFRIKYLGATNNLGSRIKIIDERFKVSKIINFSYKYTNGIYDAIEYFEIIGIKIESKGELNLNEHILTTYNFDIMINM